MNPFEQELADGLSRAASTTKIRAGSLATARRRARDLQVRRRRISVASGAVFAVSATVAAAVVVSTPDRGTVTIDGAADASVSDGTESQDPSISPQPPSTNGGGASPDAGGTTHLLASPFTWESAGSGLPISTSTQVTRDLATGALYAVSTQPGSSAGAIDSLAVRSTDGVSWETVGTVKDTPYLGNLAAYDGALYSVGTGTITGPITDSEDWGDIVTRTSPNGADWSTDLLPGIDIRAVREKYGFAYSQLADIAAGPKGTLIAQQIGAIPDVSELGLGEVWSVDVTGDGGTAYSPSSADATARLSEQGECVLPDGSVGEMDETTTGRGKSTVFSWEDVAATPEDIALYLGAPRFFLSTGGGFSEVTVPAAEAEVTEAVRLLADDEGFAVIIKYRKPEPNGNSLPTTAYLFTSDDGVTWTSGPSIDAVTYVESIDRVDGRLVAVVLGADGLSDLRTLENGVWTSTGLSGALAELGDDLAKDGFQAVGGGALTFGSSGIAAIVDSYADPLLLAPQRIVHDDYVLELRSANEWVVVDSNGNDIGSPFDSGSVNDGPVRWATEPTVGDDIEVFGDGDVALDRFTRAEIEAVMQGSNAPTVIGKQFILFSRDGGATWSATALDDAIGKAGCMIRSLIVTDSGVVIDATVVSDSADEPVTTDGTSGTSTAELITVRGVLS